MEHILLFAFVGFLAQMIDGALGMAYGVCATTFLLAFGIDPAVASASVHTAEVVTTGISGFSHFRLGNTEKGKHTRDVQVAFHQRCQHAGLEGLLVVDAGSIARRICERARWNDLIVMNLSNPPSNKLIEKFGSGFRTLIRRCAAPIMAVKDKPSRLTKALLAYDGSPKAREGLFIAAYVGSFWKTSLVVVAVNEEGEDAENILQQASSYLQARGVKAKLLSKAGNVAEMILQSAHEEGADWILMGGYGMNPVIEAALGSAVDRVLQESERRC